MIIYSCSNSTPAKIAKMREYGMGMLISTHADTSFAKSALSKKGGKFKNDIEGMPIALDNGAFGNHSNGFPFDERAFLWHLSHTILRKIDLEFVVVPDIIKGGLRSRDFSMRWADRLVGYNKLAFVVQDGMNPANLDLDERFSHIFVGGSIHWKLDTVEAWAKYAHSTNKRLHIGQFGTLARLNFAKTFLNEKDSIDSTNFVRNDSWNVIEEHINPTQMNLLDNNH